LTEYFRGTNVYSARRRIESGKERGDVEEKRNKLSEKKPPRGAEGSLCSNILEASLRTPLTIRIGLSQKGSRGKKEVQGKRGTSPIWGREITQQGAAERKGGVPVGENQSICVSIEGALERPKRKPIMSGAP